MKYLQTQIGLRYSIVVLLLICSLTGSAGIVEADPERLNPQQVGLARIAAVAAQGDLSQLSTEIHQGLDVGLTVNQIKESLVHLYAYAGFPRSLRGLQTVILVLQERQNKGIQDHLGQEASAIAQTGSKYDRGKAVLEQLTGVKESGEKKGYAEFAPVVEQFLKEHLFADLFERDVLSYSERELITISVLSGIGGAEPMLKSHLGICRNLGFTEGQLKDFKKQIEDVLPEQNQASLALILEELFIEN